MSASAVIPVEFGPPRLGAYGRFMIVAVPKVGKTHLLGTFPGSPEKKLVILSFDPGGLATLQSDPALAARLDDGSIVTHEVATDATIHDLWAALKAARQLVVDGRVQTLAWDSFTFLTKIVARHVFQLDGIDFAEDPDPKTPDYRRLVPKINGFTNEILQPTLAFPCHFVMTCHLDIREETEMRANAKGVMEPMATGRTNKRPAAMGQLRDQLSSMFGEVWYMEQRVGGKRIVKPQESRRGFSGFGSRMHLVGELPADFRGIMEHYKGQSNANVAVYDAFTKELPIGE